MRQDLFVTSIHTGHFDIPASFIGQFKQWVQFEKELDPDGAKESTTQSGWQYVFKPTETEPNWLNLLSHHISDIKTEIDYVRTKTMWVVDYDTGGYQDPHFHTVGVVKVSTILINLIGEGEIILQDPRPLAIGQGYGFAHTVKLTPGDWLAMPAYLIHNSRPCISSRSILVIDVYVKNGM